MSQILKGVFLVRDGSQRSLSRRARPSFLGHILKTPAGGIGIPVNQAPLCLYDVYSPSAHSSRQK